MSCLLIRRYFIWCTYVYPHCTYFATYDFSIYFNNDKEKAQRFTANYMTLPVWVKKHWRIKWSYEFIESFLNRKNKGTQFKPCSYLWEVKYKQIISFMPGSSINFYKYTMNIFQGNFGRNMAFAANFSIKHHQLPQHASMSDRLALSWTDLHLISSITCPFSMIYGTECSAVCSSS